MKNLLFTIYLSLFVLISITAQSNRTGSFVANFPQTYPISGNATLVDNAGAITVTFESNFSTIQGITLEVFLAKTSTLNLATDIKISTAPLDQGSSMGMPINGPFVFTVPSTVNAYDFDNILVQCTSANLLWGHANICANNLNLSAATLPTDAYQAVQTIDCSTDLAATSIVSFETMGSIELNAGFCVPLSTEFTTLVGNTYGCTIE